MNTVLARIVALMMVVTVLADQSGRPAPGPAQQEPSSYQLISQALTAGRIDRETAYKYRIFATFRDTRLPKEYRGDDSGFSEAPSVVMQIARIVNTLSPETQAELKPFFLPPSAPGSWASLATVNDEPGKLEPEAGIHGPSADAATSSQQDPRWIKIPAAGGKVLIWAQPRHPGDSAKVVAIAQEMTARIWPRLVGLFWEPLPDTIAFASGSGPELDVYLLRPRFTDEDSAYNRRKYRRLGAWRGLAMSLTYDCQKSPFSLYLNSEIPLGSATQPGLLQDVAHELTHAITGALPLQQDCKHYDLMSEATGKWAEHWVYPDAQSEHDWAPGFFVNSRKPLDRSTAAGDEDNKDAYRAYIFPFYLSTMGREKAIPAIWKAFENHDQRGGIDAGLKAGGGKGLKETFPQFAVRNLNRAVVDDYQKKDRLPESFKVMPDSYRVVLQGGSEYEKQIFMGMEYLSTEYAHFTFDRTVRTVTFDNTLTPIPWAGVWGLVKIKGQWKDPDDWTAESSKSWCRDVDDEDIQELVIVFTNNEWQDTTRKVDPGQHRPTVKAYPSGCNGWTGTSEFTQTITSTDPNITITENVRTTIRFAVDSSQIVPGQPIQYWKSVSGSISWRANVTGTCTGSGSGSVQIPNRSDDHVAVLSIWPEGGKMHYQGGSGLWPGDIPSYQVTCPDGTGHIQILFGALGFFATDGDKDELAPDGKSFSGDFRNEPAPGIIKVHHRYSFRCSTGC